MSHVVKLSIPDDLAQRIEEKRGDQSVQDYTLAALRSALYGSPVEAELRRQIAELIAIIRDIAQPTAQLDANLLGAAVHTAAEDKRIGW